MSKKLHTAIKDAYVTAYRLHAMYTERHDVTGDNRDLIQARIHMQAVSYLDTIVSTLPHTVSQPIYAAARDAAIAARNATRQEMRSTRAD
jgi:hypothetical protein